MSRLSRLAAGAAVALALATPAGAEEQNAPPPAAPSALTSPLPGPPTAAILRIEGGFSPHERWVWFDAGGTARLVRGFEAIADTLTWEPTDENVALPNTMPLFRFAAPTG